MYLLKNDYKIVDNYAKVFLKDNFYMLCDIMDLKLIKNKKVYYIKNKSKKTAYCAIKINKTTKLFHNIILPQYSQIDHINRNGLDNRRSNLRDGSNKINANNKSIQINNNSGTTGVYIEKGKNGRSDKWVSDFRKLNGKRSKKRFSINEYKDKEKNAKTLAIEYRQYKMKIYRHFLIEQQKNKDIKEEEFLQEHYPKELIKEEKKKPLTSAERWEITKNDPELLKKKKEADKKSHQKHKEKRNKQNMDNYEKNKEEIKKKNKIKIKCEICNCEFNKSSLYQHNKSKKHINNLKKLIKK